MRLREVGLVGVLLATSIGASAQDSVAVYVAPVVWNIRGIPDEDVQQREYVRDALIALIVPSCGPCTYPPIDRLQRVRFNLGRTIGNINTDLNPDSINALVHQELRSQMHPRHRVVVFDVEVNQVGGESQLRVTLQAYDRGGIPPITKRFDVADLETTERAQEALRGMFNELVRHPNMAAFRTPRRLAPVEPPAEFRDAPPGRNASSRPQWAWRLAVHGIPQSGALAGRREIGREDLHLGEYGGGLGLEFNPRGNVGAVVSVGLARGMLFTSGTDTASGEGGRRTQTDGIGHLQAAGEVLVRPFANTRVRPVVGAGFGLHRYFGSGPFRLDRFGTETVEAELRPQPSWSYAALGGAGVRFSNGAELIVLMRLEWLSGLTIDIAGETSSTGRVSSHGIVTSVSIPLR